MAATTSLPIQNRLRTIATQVQATSAGGLNDRQLELALLALFSNLDAFDQILMPHLGKDLAECEKAISGEEELGWREFLGLFFV